MGILWSVWPFVRISCQCFPLRLNNGCGIIDKRGNLVLHCRESVKRNSLRFMVISLSGMADDTDLHSRLGLLDINERDEYGLTPLCLATTSGQVIHSFVQHSTCSNKKILLRERKRHTDRVSSTPSVALYGGYPLLGGTPPWVIPHQTWPGGTPSLLREYPTLGTLHQTWPGGGDTPSLSEGYPTLGIPHPTWLGYPPPWLDLARVPPPPWTDRWTDTCQNITFPSYYVRGR